MAQRKRRWLSVPLVVGVLAVAALILRAHYHRGVHPVRTGEALPALSLVALDGSALEIKPTRGTIVYNVFATWCPPCREETPTIARAATALRKRGIEVIGIDQGEPASAVNAFAKEFGLEYPIVVDPNHQTNSLLGARVIPETIVVRDGIVQAIAVGPLDQDALDKLMARSAENEHA